MSGIGRASVTPRQKLGRSGEYLIIANIKCLDCEVGSYVALKPNTPSVDLECDKCKVEVQVKTAKTLNGKVPKYVLGGSWKPQFQLLKAGRLPRLFIVVIGKPGAAEVFSISSEEQNPSFFKIRTPLSEKAKSPGWTGFTILLSEMGNALKLIGTFTYDQEI